MGIKGNRHVTQESKTIMITARSSTMPMVGGQTGSTSLTHVEATNARGWFAWALTHHFQDNRAEMGRAIAKAMGRHRPFRGQTITQIINGDKGGKKQRPGWATVRALAAYLGLKVEDIVAPRSQSSVEGKVAETFANLAGKAEGQAVNMGDLVHLPNATENARFPVLEQTIAFFALDEPDKWSVATILAARSGHFEKEGCAKWTHRKWVETLDDFESMLQRRSERVLKGAPPSSFPPPSEDADSAAKPRRPKPLGRRKA